ncbi:MAG: lycopene beta-cyclase CrtY [Novosphingobium sp.]
MAGRRHDIVLAGGGLAGGLIAMALQQQRPDLSVLLVEGTDRLGGHRRHTWIGKAADAMAFDRFRMARWQAADFAFPDRARHLAMEVFSISADDFDAGLRRNLPPGSIRAHAAIEQVRGNGLLLQSGEEIAARTVIDCRGFARSEALDLGWRTSMERRLASADLHGVQTPMVLDAGGEQGGVFAFAQVLPTGVDELVVGEHRLSRRSLIDRRELSCAIEATCSRAGWQGDILGSEASVTPLIAGGSLNAHYAELGMPGVPIAGSRGLFIHPLTGSSMASALDLARAIAAEADLPGDQLAAMLADRARKHWRAMQAPRRLASRLLAAQGRGAQLAGRLAGLPEGTIMRLLAGKAGMTDRVRLALARG